MEILLATLATLILAGIALLAAARGRPSQILPVLRSALAAVSGNRPQIVLLGLAALFGAALVYLVYIHPFVGLGPEQPIPFSHRVHAGVKQIDCRFCHHGVERSTHPGLPPVQKCLFCHNYIISQHPQIRKEHRYFDTGTPTPWRKANFLPEHVLFNHQRHIANDIQCEACHGKVAQKDRLAGRDFRMGFCIECHRRKGANLDCWLACHS